MSNVSPSNQELLKHGLSWINLHQPELLHTLVQGFDAFNIRSVNQLSREQRHEIATSVLSGLISRLEGEIFDSDRVRLVFADALRRGAQLTDMIKIADGLHDLFVTKVRQELADQPLIVGALIDKAGYYNQLLKSAMAAGLITYESQKASK